MEKRNGCIVIHRICNEVWKKITHIDGINYNFVRNYYISNYGRVKNDSSIMKQAMRGKYYRISLAYVANNKKYKRSFSVHRLVCEYFCKPNVNKLPTVNHIDGNTENNMYTNLEWASYKDQAIHAYKMGLTYIAKGEDSHLSKITESMVRQICEYLEKGLSVTMIREKLNLSTDYTEIIARIRKRKTWKWLSKDYNFSTNAYPKEYIPDDIMHEICKMIKNNKPYNEIYNKYYLYFDKYSNPKSKYYDIKTKRTYKRISDLYF